jgi:N,N'-diacetyllegionaminate synthase
MTMPAAEIFLDKRRVAADEPTYIIAEIGVNHNGSVELAHKMVDAAKATGVDAVKFQTFRTDDLVLPTAVKADYQATTTGKGNQQEMLRKLELPIDAYMELKRHCDTVKIDFMSTAFESASLDAVISWGPVCLKWPSGELNNAPLLKQAARAKLPILLSTGMGSIAEIATAIDLLAAHGCNDIAILQCVSNYPARIEDQNLRVLPNMAATFGRPVGFSDHTIGPYAAIAARALGMSILEKHFTMDTKMEGPDHSASSTPDEFAHLVKTLRAIEIGLGDGIKRMLTNEANVKEVARKSLVYRQNLAKGHVLTEDDLTSKRPGTGIAPSRMDLFMGMQLRQDVQRDDLVDLAHIR